MEIRIKRDRQYIKTIEVAGNYYEIGMQIGQQTKDKIYHIVSKMERATTTDPETETLYQKFLPYLVRHPNVMDEIKGLADGAGLNFDTMAKMSIVELNKDHVIDRQCSTFFVSNENDWVLGHNEDGGDNDDIFLLKATYPSGTKVLSFCYYGTLAGFSANINSHGLIIRRFYPPEPDTFQ